MDKLKELLDGLVAEKSLSFEVLEQLRKVKTESDSLLSENKLLKDTLVLKDEQIARLGETVNTQHLTIKDWEIREAKLEEREKAVLDIEHKNEIANLKTEHAVGTLNQVKEVVGMVFKNTTLRTGIMKSTSEPVGTDQYGNTRWANSTNDYTEVRNEE